MKSESSGIGINNERCANEYESRIKNKKNLQNRRRLGVKSIKFDEK